MTDVSIVFVTVGNQEEALAIGQKLVQEKLAACANLIPSIHSIYWWQGEVHQDQECLLILKTRSALFSSLQARVRELHSYELPEIVSFPISEGLPDYLQWVVESTKKPR